jgi:hypothetical protein
VKSKMIWIAVLAMAVSVCYGAQQTASDDVQRFLVLRSTHFVTASETLSNTDANCSIAGTGRDATMQCRSAGGTAKASYHYNAALLLDDAGIAYIIACRVSLISRSCKALSPGVVLHGSANGERLAISDKNKIHDYEVLVSKHVGGSIPAPQAAAENTTQAGRPAAKQSGPEAPRASAAGSPSAKTPANNQTNAASDPSVTCMSYTGACVAFASEPSGADVYVDGKFVGNTPSTLTLTVGSHEIRIEAAMLKSWSRKFEAVAGSRITIRAILEPLPREN